MGNTKGRRRANGAGTLVLQPTGLYLAKWVYNGKTMTRSTKCYKQDKDGYKNAMAKLDEFVKPFLEASNIAVLENLAAKVRTIEKSETLPQDIEAQKRRIKIEDLYERYFADVNTEQVSDGTKGTYSAITNAFDRWMKEHYKWLVYIDELTKPICEEFLMHLDKRVCTHTYNHYLSLLNHIFVILVGRDNVWGLFKKRKTENKFERRALTREELEKLMIHADGLPVERKFLFYLGIYTGMRVSDCCLIKWEHVHLDKGFISLIPHKTRRYKKPVFIPIHSELRGLLERMYQRTSNHTGYVSKWNAHIYLTNHITGVVAKVFTDAGIKKNANDYLGFHVLRHTFVSVCANSGVPLPVVQSIVGHSCPEITQHYFHMDYNVCMEAVKKIALENCVSAGSTLTPFTQVASLPTVDTLHVPKVSPFKYGPSVSPFAKLHSIPVEATVVPVAK